MNKFIKWAQDGMIKQSWIKIILIVCSLIVYHHTGEKYWVKCHKDLSWLYYFFNIFIGIFIISADGTKFLGHWICQTYSVNMPEERNKIQNNLDSNSNKICLIEISAKLFIKDMQIKPTSMRWGISGLEGLWKNIA